MKALQQISTSLLTSIIFLLALSYKDDVDYEIFPCNSYFNSSGCIPLPENFTKTCDSFKSCIRLAQEEPQVCSPISVNALLYSQKCERLQSIVEPPPKIGFAAICLGLVGWILHPSVNLFAKMTTAGRDCEFARFLNRKMALQFKENWTVQTKEQMKQFKWITQKMFKKFALEKLGKGEDFINSTLLLVVDTLLDVITCVLFVLPSAIIIYYRQQGYLREALLSNAVIILLSCTNLTVALFSAGTTLYTKRDISFLPPFGNGSYASFEKLLVEEGFVERHSPPQKEMKFHIDSKLQTEFDRYTIWNQYCGKPKKFWSHEIDDCEYGEQEDSDTDN